VTDGVDLYPGGAAHIVYENVLVVADLHLGVEASLENQGLSVPRVQTKKILQYLEDIIGRVRPDTIVVAGDLKHNFDRNLTQEWQEVTRFVKHLADRVQLETIKGNHDNFLNMILRERGVPPVRKELTIGGMQIVHGHAPVQRRGLTIMGHIHPSLRLRDSVGASIKDHCYLWDPERHIIVLPALSILAAGVDVVSGEGADAMSPYFSDGGLAGCFPIVFSKEKALKFPSVGNLRASGGFSQMSGSEAKRER
jgi:hypothetical protein